MKRARTLWPRLLSAAGLTAALVAAITAFSGTGFSATAAQAQYAPQNVSPPAIQGTATVGNTLTATPGSWTSSTTPTFTYQWLRCDSKGNGCSNIAGATTSTYLLQPADAGNSVRVEVTAKNADGTSTARSDFRTVSAATTTTTTTAKTTTTTSNSKTILAANVTLPDRLTVNSVKSTPFVLRSRRPFVIRFHVVNQRGQSVQGALVYALGLPYGWTRNAPEVPTNATGWATIVMRPTSNLPLKRGALVIFVRARVAGQNLLAGASTRRLVQVSVR